MQIDELISQLKKLNLPVGQYAVFGSAVLAVRNIREAPNIDVIVNNKLWKNLLTKGFKPDNEGFIRVNLVKISNWWFAPTQKSLSEMIVEAETIKELPFVKLEYVRWYKSKLSSDKDKNDVKLIDEYISKSKSNIPFGLDIKTYSSVIDIFLNKIKSDRVLDEGIISSIVFGSVSRGQATGDSDLDIFLIYDSSIIERAVINDKINQIILNLRETKEYISLSERNIFSEIYPFYISKTDPQDVPWVALDATIEGKVISDRNKFGKRTLEDFLTKINSIGGRRAALEGNKWCWVLFKDFKQVINGEIDNIMDNRKRSNLLFDAAKESLEEARFSFDRKAYNLVIRRAQESVELCLSGLLAFIGVHYPKNHDQAPLLFNIITKQGIDTEDSRSLIEKISIDLSRKRGPALHQEDGYDKETAEKSINDADFVIEKILEYRSKIKPKEQG